MVLLGIVGNLPPYSSAFTLLLIYVYVYEFSIRITYTSRGLTLAPLSRTIRDSISCKADLTMFLEENLLYAYSKSSITRGRSGDSRATGQQSYTERDVAARR